MKTKILLLIILLVGFFGAAVKNANATLRLYDGFERGIFDTANNWYLNTNGPSSSRTVNAVNTKASKGRYSLKMSLTRVDSTSFRNQLAACNHDGNPATRCDYQQTHSDTLLLRENGSNWIGFSAYWPASNEGAEYFVSDTQPEQFFQIHTPPFWDKEGNPQGPAVSFTTSDWEIHFNEITIGTDTPLYDDPLDGVEWYFPWDRGKWVDWVIQYKPSDTANGILKVWKDGAKIIDFTGITSGFSLAEGSFLLNWGVYKRPWQKAPSSVSKRTMYFDEIRVGDTDSSYAEVNPSQNPPQCNDGIDNDGDGRIDFNINSSLGDSGCTLEYGDNSEGGSSDTTPPADVNQDGKTNIQDIQICVKVITGTETNSGYISKCKAAALPSDVVNIKDIQEIIRKITSG